MLNIEYAACLFMVLDQELAGLEFVGVHDVQQLPPSGIILLQVFPVELLHRCLSCQCARMHPGQHYNTLQYNDNDPAFPSDLRGDAQN